MIEALKRELDCPADQMILYTEEPMSRHTSFRMVARQTCWLPLRQNGQSAV